MASFGFAAAGFRTEKGTIEGVGVVFAVAFLGLLIVVVGAIVSLAVVGGRNGTRRSAAWITGIAIVLLIGVAGMWATVALASTADRFELHPGPLVLTLGAVLFAVVVWAPALRDLWVRR